MVQSAKRVALDARVSTEDQTNEHQLEDLRAFAARAGYEILAEHSETASGAKDDRQERAKAIKLAQSRVIDAILVSELSRWGRSTLDLLTTLKQLDALGVSVIAQNGFSFDESSPGG